MLDLDRLLIDNLLGHLKNRNQGFSRGYLTPTFSEFLDEVTQLNAWDFLSRPFLWMGDARVNTRAGITWQVENETWSN